MQIGLEDLPGVEAELEVQAEQVAAPDPVIQDRRTGRPKQYTARMKAFRQSLDRPLAKLGLLGTVICFLVLLLDVLTIQN